jgi:predicted ribosome quality control (RQC) complex YloA/Tae2 family protein
MIIDGAFIHALVKELNSKLNKARLEKISHVTSESFLFQFYFKGEKLKLIIDLNANFFSAYITEKKVPNKDHSQFLLTLKKQLEGGILDSITQHQTDRVMLFNFTVYDFIDGPVSKTLVFEAMGKHSNLILIQDGKIVDTFKKMFFETGRQLIPGATFEFFPTDKKPFDHIDYHMIETPKNISASYMGISMKLATYLFENHKQISELPLNPTKDMTKNTGYFFDIFPNDHQKKSYQTLSELCDDQEIINTQFKQSYDLFIQKQLDKYNRKLGQLELSLDQTRKQLDDKTFGDLIYQSGLNLNDKQSEIIVYDTKVMLDPTLTLNENAQKYYKSYQKAKRGLIHINEQINETKALRDLFEEFKTYLSFASQDDIADLENDLIPYGYKAKKKQVQKKKSSPNILKIVDQDAIYIIGKNSLQNQYVTHELARQEDYFFHVKDAPGSHLIVKAEGLDEKIIRKAAMLAAYFSSLRYSSSIPVDYTQIKFVKKIPKVPGYKVILKNQKTMFIDINEELINSYL